MQLRPANEVSWPPPRPARGRRIIAWVLAFGVPLLLVGGYTAWWLSASAELRDGTLAWIADRRAEGWKITYETVSRHGFPLRLGVRFDHAAVGTPAGGSAWQASRAKLSAPLWGEQRLRLALGGDQVAEVAAEGRGRRRYSGHAEQFSFDLTPAEGWMPNGRLAVRNLDFRSADAGDDIGIGRLDLFSTGDPAAATAPDVSTWALRVDGFVLRLPKAYARACGREVTRLAADAKLFGSLQPRPWPASAARWRDDGGVIEVQRLTLVCGALSIDGEGTLALDRQGQPIGAMSTHIQGYEAMLDRLSAAQTIEPHTAAAAKILLRALARSNSEGASTLSAPLTLQDRSLSVGPVTLLRVPKVSWLGSGGR